MRDLNRADSSRELAGSGGNKSEDSCGFDGVIDSHLMVLSIESIIPV
ncbi:MAG: hypothetical protein KF767_17595 [Bdellovibrionaceae bacterium]|nr:hypothetical protein [Pseudobdellovibrionaceae bacterium]